MKLTTTALQRVSSCNGFQFDFFSSDAPISRDDLITVPPTLLKLCQRLSRRFSDRSIPFHPDLITVVLQQVDFEG